MGETHYIRTGDNVILRFASIDVIKEWLSEGKLRWEDKYLINGKDWVVLKDYFVSDKIKKPIKITTEKHPLVSAAEQIESQVTSKPIDQKESPPWAEAPDGDHIAKKDLDLLENEQAAWNENDLRLPPVRRKTGSEAFIKNQENINEENDDYDKLFKRRKGPLKIIFNFIVIIMLGVGAFWITLKILESKTDKKIDHPEILGIVHPSMTEQDSYQEIFISEVIQPEDILLSESKKDISLNETSAEKSEIIIHKDVLDAYDIDMLQAKDVEEKITTKSKKRIKKEPAEFKNNKRKKKSANDEKNYEALMSKGKELMTSDPAKAIDYLTSASNKKPLLAEPLSKIGECYSRIGNPKQAIIYYNKALVNNREHLSSIIGLARAYRRLGLTGQAQLKYKEYLKLSPNGKNANEARENIGQ